ncbi:uncharacterized protein LOC124274127 [Haliotis rubra]|uniref:uncharacterized protein LOC124274127 n=1 Tax=Haliotis rubra TaxID=36100 RepID=UPI001EE60AE4|nr:uncharacterized protein LOC124274127 [Haliotis rubra]XP_046565405.1 uncharacterized protein LOC124274127 [Haliotis rubra]XP_046565406.1 uncharacterized protein LOC124274127 [Haliotis rubra]
MSYIEFYHYTDEEGKNAIVQSMTVKQSRKKPGDGDVAFGEGVYGTTMDPDDFSKQEVARNNYDGAPGFWEDLMDIGRVDFAIKILLPVSEVKFVNYQSRNILIYKGDIDLRMYTYCIIEVEDEEDEEDEDSDW